MVPAYEYKIDLVAPPFGNLKYRDNTILVVCKDSDGKFLLGASPEYPDGIVRLMGGGVNSGEELTHAAIREVKEEMNIDTTSDELKQLAQVNIEGHYQGETFRHTVTIYYLDSQKDDSVAGDDVSEIVAYSEDEYKQLIHRFNSLKSDHLSAHDGSGFSWGDYGKVYAFIHQVALDEISKRPLLGV